ncbi:MAG: TIGR02449 family protein [Gammaproteobacteria bacterium]|nr:MAG: TIGR02449 family protein [Gammaproteobacteria bacterium]RKZ38898.1 MAG: TIGR02449 family protein [Gammaproteobacteria bacterium]RKZ75687.1 MAG: TIGR02449 family protein [Gammaproteobacteria bacterium]
MLIEKPDLQSLKTQIDALIHISKQLADENQVLRESEANLISERATLQEKNALARTHIETMIARLKSMEVSS